VFWGVLKEGRSNEENGIKFAVEKKRPQKGHEIEASPDKKQRSPGIFEKYFPKSKKKSKMH